MSNKKTIIILLILFIIIIALFIWLKPNDQNPETSNQTTNIHSVSENVSSGNINTTSQTKFVTGLENLPASLYGTDVDGSLHVDANGNLIISRELRQLFDYFLSTMGEEDLATIIQRVKAYIRHHLPAQAAAQAEQIFENYIQYQKDIDQLPSVNNNLNDLDKIRQQKEEITRIRNKYFDHKTIIAFFDDEDAYDQYSLRKLEIINDKTLSATQKQQHLTQLLSEQPSELQEQIKLINQYQELTQLTENWSNRNGTPQELRELRINTVGVDATNRLESLDKENLQWNNKIDQYINKRNDILNNKALSQLEKQQQLNKIKQQNFNEQELIRVDTYETMHDQGIAFPK